MLNKWKNWAVHWNLRKHLRETFDSFSQALHRGGGDAREREINLAFQSLICRLLQQDGFIPRQNREIYQRLLEEKYDHRTAERQMEELLSMTPLPLENIVDILKDQPQERKRSFLEFLLSLAVAVGDTPESIALLKDLAVRFRFEWEALEILRKNLRESEERRQKIVSSGLGVLAALVVLLVFVLTAQLLMPVVFGLIFACILLPVEKFFEKNIQQRSSFVYWLNAASRFLFYPLRKISSLIRRKDSLHLQENFKQKQLRKQRNRIVRATVFTMLSVFLFFLLIAFGVSKLTGRYVRSSIEQKMVTLSGGNAAQGDAAASGDWVSRCNLYLEKLRDHFESIPGVKKGISIAKLKLEDPAFHQKILSSVFGGKNGVVSLTTGLLSSAVSFFCNLLLTVFFTLLFMMKLAEFCGEDNSDKQKSEYLVRMFFNGVWLPDADETVIGEARRIIEGVFFRLRTWLRGYFMLVAVDATVYTTLFGLLGVPFFLPLGLLAGCGILLPYLGPVISCAVTIVVTFAAGGGSGFMLTAILVCYLCYNGVVEQFILYPAVIGESLGLSTLETIIVVLLGAIFAGIPGMILALPVASVAKYIIPQCYRSFLQPRVLKKRNS